MSYSLTESWSNTYTEARVRAVMHSVLSDLMVLSAAGHVKEETLIDWHKDLTFLLTLQALEYFQLQFRSSDGGQRALNYHVSDDGSLHEDSDSGGIDYYSLPKGTRVSLFVSMRWKSPRIEEARKYMRENGWGTSGEAIQGTTSRDRAYSKDGYGLIREQVGKWS